MLVVVGTIIVPPANPNLHRKCIPSTFAVVSTFLMLSVLFSRPVVVLCEYTSIHGYYQTIIEWLYLIVPDYLYFIYDHLNEEKIKNEELFLRLPWLCSAKKQVW